MAISGDPIVPRIDTLAWLADPPLYHWFAAVLGTALSAAGNLFGAVLPFHAGARIASGLFMLSALWLIHVAARGHGERAH